MSTESKSMFQFHLFKTPSFVLVCISSFIQSFGFYVPYMYLSGKNGHQFSPVRVNDRLLSFCSSRHAPWTKQRSVRFISVINRHLYDCRPTYLRLFGRLSKSQCFFLSSFNKSQQRKKRKQRTRVLICRQMALSMFFLLTWSDLTKSSDNDNLVRFATFQVNLLLLHNCAMTCSGLLTLTLPNYTTYETLVTYSSVIGLAICKLVINSFSNSNRWLILWIDCSLYISDETSHVNPISGSGKRNQRVRFHASLLRIVWNLRCPSSGYVWSLADSCHQLTFAQEARIDFIDTVNSAMENQFHNQKDWLNPSPFFRNCCVQDFFTM